MLHGHVALGRGDVARQHGLACHQVVPAPGPAFLFRVVADVEKPAHAVVKRGEVHPGHQRVQPRGRLALAVFQHGLPRREKPRVHVAAVNGGDVRRKQRHKRRRVVPVVKMPPVPRHTLKRVQHPRRVFGALPGAYYAHVRRRGVRRQRKADVRRRGAPRKPHRRLLLKIIRREEAVLRGEKAFKVGEAALCRADEILPLVFGKLRLPVRGQRQRKGRRR